MVRLGTDYRDPEDASGGYAVARSWRRTGAGRQDCSTRSFSSLASWNISSGACEQCQPAPISPYLEDRSARKKRVTTNRGSTSRRTALWGTMRRPLARSTASVSRIASASLPISSRERQSVRIAAVLEKQHRQRGYHRCVCDKHDRKYSSLKRRSSTTFPRSRSIGRCQRKL